MATSQQSFCVIRIMPKFVLFLILLLSSLATAIPPLPVGPPQPPPSYMVDPANVNSDPPDRGTLNGPVLSGSTSNASSVNTTSHHLKLAAQASSSYWLPSITHGEMPFAPSGYQFYRNVKSYGATGDGTTDDTAAINRAITDGNRCGNITCGSTSVLGALVYFPAGTYRISSPIIQYYYTQFVGDPTNKPTIMGLPDFEGIALIDTDVYIPGGNGDEWYINQNQFYRQIRNFVIDTTAMGRSNTQGDQTYVPTGIHWQVAQATSLQNIDFVMSVSDASGAATAVGLFMENGSGGFVSDLTFTGGNIGFRAGSQQFTARNLQFTSCLTAISMIWDWGFNFKNLNILSCYIAIDCTAYGGAGDQGTGSISVIDSVFNGVPYGITVNQVGFLPDIVLDNLLIENSNVAVQYSGAGVILSATSGETINSWAMGMRYTTLNDPGSSVQSNVSPAPSKPAILLDSNGYIFERSKPQYETFDVSSFVNVLNNGVSNNGQGDQTAAINSVLSGNVGSIIFFPAGIYLVQGTVKVPVGTRMLGEGWSQIMASGSYFQDMNKPQVMLQFGNPGDSGILEISDMLFTVQGPTAGAILVEWNVHESSQGSAGMWDAHFRVGGAQGTSLSLADCPKGSINTNCIAANMLLHMTSQSSGYFENVWAWVADHDLDASSGDANTTTATQISIFSARGILIESQGPTWYYGSASEHNVLYQYELYTASNIYMGHMQTETPYFQAVPTALTPFGTPLPSDPQFQECVLNSTCQEAWALRVINSTNLLLYSGGFYSFFQNYDLSCNSEEHCQERLIDISYSQGLYLFNIFTKGAVEVVSPEGGIAPAEETDNRNGYTTEISAYLEFALEGADIGGSSSGDHRTPSCVTILPLPCTTVAPQATFTMSQACISGILALPTTGAAATQQNSPPGPADCNEVCDFFRLITGTCCGSGGNICNPIEIPAGVILPMDIPLPSGYIPNQNITIPDPDGYDPNAVFGNGTSPSDCNEKSSDCGSYPDCVPTTTYDAGTELLDSILNPGGSCFPFPLIIPPPGVPLPVDPPCFGIYCHPCIVGICTGYPDPDDSNNCSDGEGNCPACPIDDDTCGCDLSTETGRCANGNFPLYDPDTNSIECDVPDSEVPDYISECQLEADENFDDTINEIECETDPDYCDTSSTKRGLSDLLVSRVGKAPKQKQSNCIRKYKPPSAFTTPSPGENCDYTFICNTDFWPNVCNNARSAINLRGKPSVLTWYRDRKAYGRSITKDWYNVHPKGDAIVKQSGSYRNGYENNAVRGQPFTGWGLVGCEVEEYPWGTALLPGGYTAGSPIPWNDRSVLRLIPQPENAKHGGALGRFGNYIKQLRLAQTPPLSETGWTFCVRITGSKQPNDYILGANQADNICGQAYGPAFLLVNDIAESEYESIQNDPVLAASETQFWDPWFDQNNQKFVHTLYSSGNVIRTSSIPSRYGDAPSPGVKTWLGVNTGWSNLAANGVPMGIPAGVGPAGTTGQNLKYDPPLWPGSAAPGILRRDSNGTVLDAVLDNSTSVTELSSSGVLKTQRGTLTRRQLEGGSFLNPKIYTEVLLCPATYEEPCLSKPCDVEDRQYGPNDGSAGTPPLLGGKVYIAWEEYENHLLDENFWDVYDVPPPGTASIDVCTVTPNAQIKFTDIDDADPGMPAISLSFNLDNFSGCTYTGGTSTTAGTLDCSGFAASVQCSSFTNNPATLECSAGAGGIYDFFDFKVVCDY